MSISKKEVRPSTAGSPSVYRVILDAVLVAAVVAGAATLVMCLQNPARIAQLTDIPSGVLLGVATPTAVTLVCVAQWWVHQHFPYRDFVQHNEVAGFIIAVAGSLYAVVLGFLTLVAWQHYSDARQLVATETAATTDAWHVAVGLPAVRRHRVRDDILQYSNVMVSREWPAMNRGDDDLQSPIIIMDAIDATENFTPSNMRESNAQSATVAQLGVMHDERQRRVADNRSGVTGFEWVVLFIGATCVIGFCWLFGMPNARIHLLMTAAVTIIITTTLVLLFELQYPFRSGLGIDYNDWTAVIDHIHQMQAGPQSSMRM
jgi:hypothetical protein